MNAPLSRCTLLGASTAAIGAVALPVSMAALASSAPDPDADLFGLLDRWHEAREAWDATDASFSEAHERAASLYPPRPNALRWRSRDLHHHLEAQASLRTVDAAGCRRSFYNFNDVEKLRGSEPVTRWALADDSVDPPPREFDPEGEARRQEIIEAHDEWMEERKAVENTTGYTAASELAEALYDSWNAVDDSLILCPPRTIAGLVRKAAWIADCMSKNMGRDDLGEVFSRQVAAFGGAGS